MLEFAMKGERLVSDQGKKSKSVMIHLAALFAKLDE